MHISSSFNVRNMQLINLKNRHSNCSKVKHIRLLSEVRLLITHLQILNFCLLMMATQSLVSFSSQIATSILLRGNLPQFLHFRIANNIDFICKKKIYCYGYFITELGISKNKTLVTLLTKILVSTKKEFWVITSHSCNQ